MDETDSGVINRKLYLKNKRTREKKEERNIKNNILKYSKGKGTIILYNRKNYNCKY